MISVSHHGAEEENEIEDLNPQEPNSPGDGRYVTISIVFEMVIHWKKYMVAYYLLINQFHE